MSEADVVVVPTLNATEAVWERAPDVPVMVIELETAVELVGMTVNVEVTPPAVGVTVDGLKLQVAPDTHGFGVLRVTAALKPFKAVTVTLEVVVAPLATGDGLRGVDVTVKS